MYEGGVTTCVICFHGGSFKCATKAKCPILPISYEEYKGMTTVELAAMVKTRIEAKTQEVV